MECAFKFRIKASEFGAMGQTGKERGVDCKGLAGHIVRMSEPTAIVRTRVPAKRLQRAERVLRKLGLTPADAVNMLLAQIEIRQGLPFDISVSSRPLLSSDEQAMAWTEAFGAY
jgi:addiction module RelB/DinJ family antitoxin